MLVQTDEQKEAEIERRTQDRVARAIESLPVVVRDTVEASMVRAADINAQAMEKTLRNMVADKELMGNIATVFQTHYLRTWREWLGAKVWNFMLYGILGAVLAWLSFKQFVGGEK